MPRRRDSPGKGECSLQCIVVGQDLECRDDLDMRVATRHDGHPETKFTLLDVPRDSLTVTSPAGHTALAVRCTETKVVSIPTAHMKATKLQMVTEPHSPKQAASAPDASACPNHSLSP
jgi:hypothetical protein